MADRETPERGDQDAAERFDGFLETLLGDGRPSPEAVDDRDEAEMARMAAELAASGRPGAASAPDPAFIEQLRLRMREADAGIDAVRVPPPVREQPLAEGSARWRLSRRQLLQAGFGAAAGMAAGVIGVSLVAQGQRRPIGGRRRRSSPGRASGRRSPGWRTFPPETPSASAPRRSTASSSTTAARSAPCHRSAPTWAAPSPTGRTGRTFAVRATAPASGSTGAWPTAGVPGAARAPTAVTRMPTRSSCPTSCVPRSRWPMA